MQHSKIEWTDHSENPIRTKAGGFYCVKVSPGCKFCYAEKQAQMVAGFKHGTHTPYRAMSTPPDLELRRDVLAGWARKVKPARRFVSSMTDIFADFVPEEWSIDILEAMSAAPSQTFQILTKRANHLVTTITTWLERTGRLSVPANIWVGVSVEDQQRAQERLPLLLQVPALIRWVSAEPLLQGLNLQPWLPGIQWLVAGGESGPHARPPHAYWFEDLRDQAADAGTAFFFKQWGEWHPDHLPGAVNRVAHVALDGKVHTGLQDPPRDSIVMYRIGKANAGHILDGHVLQDFPL